MELRLCLLQYRVLEDFFAGGRLGGGRDDWIDEEEDCIMGYHEALEEIDETFSGYAWI